MFDQHLLKILKLFLLVKFSYSFKTPKHNLISYYKTVNNVFLTNPKNHSTSYGVYVTGETIYLDIPTSVVNVSTIVNWKVINADRDRLMFVHNKKPQILINQKTIKQMKFGGYLSGPIIALGNNEALHVPSISSDQRQPDHRWNYLDLLYFNVASESVSVIQRLPWLKSNDWWFFKHWKLTDYIHFDDKLYLLIKLSYMSTALMQEISIIRLCLDRGSSRFISSAVEIHYTSDPFKYPPNFMIDAVFQVSPKDAKQSKISQNISLYVITYSVNTKLRIEKEHFISQFEQLFDMGARLCASGNQSNEISGFYHYIGSKSAKCKKMFYKPCSVNGNFIPSFDITEREFVSVEQQYYAYITVPPNMAKLKEETEFEDVKYHSVTLAHPFYLNWFVHVRSYFYKSYISTRKLTGRSGRSFQLARQFDSKGELQLQFYVNQKPLGFFFVTKTNQIIFLEEFLNCLQLENCKDCIMYGLYFGCFWSGAFCTSNHEPGKMQTVNVCFKINRVSPLMFPISLSETLTIELDTQLDLDSHEYLVIKAGPDNDCKNISMNGLLINCSVSFHKSGIFNVSVNLMSDKYAELGVISAVYNGTVETILPENKSNLRPVFVLFFYLLLVILFFLIFFMRKNHENMFSRLSLTKQLKSLVGTLRAVTRMKAGILHSGLNVKTRSTKVRRINSSLNVKTLKDETQDASRLKSRSILDRSFDVLLFRKTADSND